MLIFSEGGKGGVGKTLMCSSLIYSLNQFDSEVLVIDTDTSNPDVYKAHKDWYHCELQQIDTINDWAKFLTLIDKYKERDIIVNMAARNQDSISNWGDTIKEITDDIRVFFMLNTQKDSIILLKNYAETIVPEKIIPTKNLYFGEDAEFSLYNNSDTRKIFKKEFYIDKMLDSAVAKLYSERIPFKYLADELNVGDRIFFERWLATTKKRIIEVF